MERGVLGDVRTTMNNRESASLDRLARVTDRHGAATRHASGQPGKWHSGEAQLPSVSGNDCALALERCGLVRCEEVPGIVWMECGASYVAVPMCDAVPAETLVDILSTAGLSRQGFLEELRRMADRGSDRTCG
jgi:hypothetical protein